MGEPTPGPWTFEPAGVTAGSFPWRIVAHQARSAMWKHNTTARPHYLALAIEPEDAVLIAAAPDLLATCESSLAALEDLELADVIDVCSELRAAISKAKSGSPSEGKR